MAKVSARGCVRLASASRDRTIDGTSSIERARDRLVLRSDGAILGASDYHHHGDGYWSRGGLSIRARIKPDRDKLAVFAQYAQSRGYTLKEER